MIDRYLKYGLIGVMMGLSIVLGMMVFMMKYSNSQIKTETIYKYDTIRIQVIDTIIKYDTIKITNRLDFKAFKCESVFIKTENINQIYDYLKSNSKIDIYKSEMINKNYLSNNWNFGLGVNYDFYYKRYGISLNLKYRNFSFNYDIQNKVFGAVIWLK